MDRDRKRYGEDRNERRERRKEHEAYITDRDVLRGNKENNVVLTASDPMNTRKVLPSRLSMRMCRAIKIDVKCISSEYETCSCDDASTAASTTMRLLLIRRVSKSA